MSRDTGDTAVLSYRSGAERGEFPARAAGWYALAAMVLALLVALAYQNGLTGKFVLDSQALVRDDRRVHGIGGEHLRLIFTKTYWWPLYESDLYRPLTTLSFALNYNLLKNAGSPVGFHIVNTVLHYANVLLVFGLLRRHLRGWWTAFAGACVYAVHPLNTECVTNIAGRADLLVTGCLLSVLALHAMGREDESIWLTTARRMGIAVLAVAAVLCKESGVLAIGLMALEDLFAKKDEVAGIRPGFWRRLRHWDWFDYVCALQGFLALLAIRIYVARNTPIFEQAGSDNPLAISTFWIGRLTAVTILGRYLLLAFWPARLSADYSHHAIGLFGERLGWDVAELILVIALLAGLAWLAWRRRGAVAFFMAFAAMNLFLLANILFPIGTIMGERFMYLPLIGIIGATAAIVEAWSLRATLPRWASRAAAALVVFIVGLLTLRTRARNVDWLDGEHLFASVTRVFPDSLRGWKGLAGAIEENDPDNKQIDERIADAERAVAILDRWPLPLAHQPTQLFVDLAHYYIHKGDVLAERAGQGLLEAGLEARAWFHKAEPILERAIMCDHEVNQASRESRLKRGMAPSKIYDVGQPRIYDAASKMHLRLGDAWRAANEARYSVHLMPGDPKQWRLLSLCERTVGNWHAAAVAALEALVLGDDSPPLRDDLVIIYNQLTPGAPSIVYIDGKPNLNAGNGQLLLDLREACRDLVRRFLEVQQPRDAHDMAEAGEKNYGCPPGTFKDLLPGSP